MFRTRRPLSRPALPTKSVPLPFSDLCAPSLPRPGRTVGVHPERLGAFGPLPSTFNSKLSTFNSPSLSPFPAILTSSLQLIENTATLSPVPATLTSRVKHKSFVCHSYKKHRGWGTLPLLTPHDPLPTSYPLKPLPHMAHPYLCTCKKGPAAREPRYSPCAAS
jgi:hypothetical protein